MSSPLAGRAAAGRPLVVTLQVTCAADTDASNVVEVLARVGAGLALDGLLTAVFAHRDDDADEEDQPCAST